MKNYKEIYNRYVDSLSNESKRKSVLSRFDRLTISDDTKNVIKSCILYTVYGKSAKTLINAEVTDDPNIADKLFSIATKISKYDARRFNLAVSALNNTFDKSKKAYKDILWFLDRCNPDDYNDMFITEIYDKNLVETRKALWSADTSATIVCNRCGKSKKLTEFRFGREVCKECESDTNESGVLKVTRKSINEKAKSEAKKIIENFVSGGTNEASTDDKVSVRIDRINEMRLLYTDLCDRLTRDVHSDDVDKALNKIDIVNKLLMEVLK